MINLVVITGSLMMGMTAAAIAAVTYYDKLIMKY